jgi:hypothetical protein
MLMWDPTKAKKKKEKKRRSADARENGPRLCTDRYAAAFTEGAVRDRCG